MKIKTVNNYMNDENTYIVCEGENALVIDPGNGTEEIMKEAKGANITHVLLTHCHYDHIAYLKELVSLTGADIVCSEKCAENIKNPDVNLSLSGLGYKLSVKRADIIMGDGEEKNFSGLNVKCIHTPGHTNGGVCYLIGDSLFSGDTLFLRSVGRCDLPTGDYDELISSVREKIYTLDPDTEVYPGHGNATRVGYEKMYNLYVKG